MNKNAESAFLFIFGQHFWISNQWIMKIGDTYFCGNKPYKLTGDTLYEPRWTNYTTASSL